MKHHLLRFWLLGFIVGLGSGPRAQTIDPTLNISSLRQPAEIKAAIQQADGKHVLVGPFTTAEGAPSAGLARYNANHTADQAFNTTLAGLGGTVDNVRQLPSGKLLLIGPDTIRLGNVIRRNLLRLNADGTPDASFDAGFAVPLATQRLATAVQPDGKILVGGDFQVFNGVVVNRLVRLLPDGAIDTGFTLGAALNGRVRKILAQPDNKILVGGSFSTPRRLVRLEANGAVDNTFTSPLTSANGTGVTGVEFIGLQPDGKIVVGGTPMNVSAGVIRRIARLLPNGNLDNTFQTPNTTDYPALLMNPYDAANVAILANGRIVLSGYTSTSYNGTRLNGLMCLEANGAVSNSLANILLPDEQYASTGAEYVTSLFYQANGQWLVAGVSQLVSGQRSYVALLNANGTLDASFAPNLLTAGFITSVVQQPDTKLVVGGAFDEINGARVENLARLASNGAVDTAFSRRARVRYGVSQVVLTAAGDVLAASNYRSGITRFLPSGALDTGFAFGAGAVLASVNSVVVQPDGRIIATDANTTLLRLLANGQIDNSFTPYSNGRPVVLALQPNGKLLVGGFLDFDQPLGQYTRALVRLLPDGSRDATFTEMTDPMRFHVSGIAFQSTGKIVVSGRAYTGGNQVIRLLATGQSDPTFTPLPIARSYDGATALCIQPNDRILVNTYPYANYNQGTLIRLLADGAVDNSFASVPLQGMAYSTITQLDGKLVLGGTFSSVGSTPRAGLVRLEAQQVLPVATSRQVAAGVQVWPVPARSALRVQLPAATSAEALMLLTVQGKVVVQKRSPAINTTLDVHQLPAGVYLLRIDYADGPVTRRVVVE